MADLSDVTAQLAQTAFAAACPNGASAPSVAGGTAQVFVYEGWPTKEDLDAAMKTGNVHVSVYPMQGGSSASVAQYLDRQQVVSAPVHGLTVAIDEDAGTVTLGGMPTAGEALSLTVDGKTYSRSGATAGTIAQAIAADAAGDFPHASVDGRTLTFPSSRSLEARSGAQGTACVVTHRQKQPVMVTVWAPTPALRSAVAKAVDAAIKASQRVVYPDGSQGLVRGTVTNTNDERINDGIFRRDLIYEVEYATLDTYPVFEVTTFGVSIDAGPSMVGHVGNATITSEGI